MHSDNTTKALIVYEPPISIVNDDSAVRWRLFSKIDDFYAKRSSAYYSFIILFLAVSVFTRCLCMKAPLVGYEYLAEMESVYLKSGHGFRFAISYFVPAFIYVAIAFFSGFTVFSFPLTCFAALQFFYKTSFIFFTAIDRAFGLGFVHCFLYVGAYALTVVAASAFFAEARLHYKRYVGVQRSRNAYFVYISLFLLFSITHYSASTLSFYLLFNT